MMFPSSVLTKKILFVEKVSSTDTYGTPTTTEKEKFYVWVNMFSQRPSMDYKEHSSTPSAIVEWKMNYKSGINNSMAIKYDDKYYKILDIEELGEKRGLRIETHVVKYSDF